MDVFHGLRRVVRRAAPAADDTAAAYADALAAAERLLEAASSKGPLDAHPDYVLLAESLERPTAAIPDGVDR